MPIIQSAKKKVRKDKKKTLVNKKYEHSYKKTVNSLKNQETGKAKKSLRDAYSLLDKAAKKGVIHKKKANRLKSELAAKSRQKSTLKK